MIKAHIVDSVSTTRGVNVVLPAGAKFSAWFGGNGTVNGLRIDNMSRQCVRELGEALIEAAHQHAKDCGHES